MKIPRQHPQSVWPHGREQYGFTLIEVLIALLVLSIGLLGLAALQTSGLRSSQMARMRTTATQLAYDISDRMRANRAGMARHAYTIAANDPDPASGDNDSCEQAQCTAGQMARYDLATWRRAIHSLPGGTGSITTRVDAAVEIHTITVYWDEYRKGATGTACGPDPALDLRCISLSL